MKLANVTERGYLFNSVPTSNVPKSGFDMSYNNLTTMEAGKLYPVQIQETLPGDVFEMEQSAFIRTAPMLAPIYGQFDVQLFTFFVPNRIIWNKWDQFISMSDGRKTMKQQSEYEAPLHPQLKNLTGSDITLSKEQDHFFSLLGIHLPRKVISGKTRAYVPNGFSITLLPFLAYGRIWDDWFRDENLCEPITRDPSVDADCMWINNSAASNQPYLKFVYGNDDARDPFLKKAWIKDYFTSALPTPQRGPDVLLPLGDSATLKFDQSKVFDGTEVFGAHIAGAHASLGQLSNSPQTGGTGDLYASSGTVGTQHVALDITKYTTVDLTNATSATINTLRTEFALQSFYEALARTGSRIRSYFDGIWDVDVPDHRLDRPELLGSARIPIQIQTNTSESASQIGNNVINQGNQTGNGLASGTNYIEPYTCLEHGYVITLAAIMPKPQYSTGINRMWFKYDWLDYALPHFANLGEQEVFTRELYYDGSDASDSVFGYQSRYAEYKFNADNVSGDFIDSLSFWTASRKFNSTPLLNESFIYAPPTKDFFAVTDSSNSDHYYASFENNIAMIRPLPLFPRPITI